MLLLRRKCVEVIKRELVKGNPKNHVRSTVARSMSLLLGTTAALSVPYYGFTKCDAVVVSDPSMALDHDHQSSSSSVTSTLVDKAVEVVRLVNKLLEYLNRLLLYAVLGIPVVSVASTAYVLGGVNPAIEDLVWDCCLWAIQQLGPTFVKLAQWASTRPDLYPPALINRLESLQDDVKVNYSRETVEKTLRGAFGPNWKDYIELDYNKPLGAGCVAQVPIMSFDLSYHTLSTILTHHLNYDITPLSYLNTPSAPSQHTLFILILAVSPRYFEVPCGIRKIAVRQLQWP